MFESRAIMYALYTTLLVAMISALVATVIGTVTAIAISHMKPVSKNIFMSISNIPMLNADIVTGIALMLAFIAFGISLGFKTVLISHAFFEVVFPDIMPGVLSGFLLAFTMSLDDFIITHFTKGAGINTLSTLIYSEVRRGIRPSMYALSTVIFVVVLVVLLIANFRKQPEKD